MYTWRLRNMCAPQAVPRGATCWLPGAPPNPKSPRTPENSSGEFTRSRNKNKFTRPIMMNLAAIALLLCSLATAGVFEPKPANNHAQKQQDRPWDPMLIREGHRLVVVEYEHHIADKASRPAPHETTHRLIEEAKGKFHQAAELLPNVGQGISMPEVQAKEPKVGSHSVKDVVCDAYGMCKEKLSSLVRRGNHKASEKASHVGFKDAAKKAADKASELSANTEDVAKFAEEKATEFKERAKDTVDKASKDKEKVKETAEMAIERAAQAKAGAKDTAEKTVHSIKESGQDLASNVSGMGKKAAEATERTAVEARRNLTDILRRARDVGYDATAYVWSPRTVGAIASIMQLLGFSIAYGTCVWVTFVSSHVLSTAMPRQQFGMVQSKLYPVYFRAVAYSIALTFLSHFFGCDRKVAAERVQGNNLICALGFVLVNMLYLEPQATKVMFERMKKEKEEGRGRDMADVIAEPAEAPATAAGASPATTTTTMHARDATEATKSTISPVQATENGRMAMLNRKLRRLNRYSSLLNVATLMSLTWHLVHLSRQQQASC